MSGKGNRILVTGGAGYIGSHTCVALSEAGYTPVIADNFSNSRKTIPGLISSITGKEIETIVSDLAMPGEAEKLFRNHGPFEAVIHFAAFKSVSESVSKPLSYFRNNIYSLVNLLAAMPENGRIVFSSSCTVYGEPDKLPVSEEAPFGKSASPYGETKQICEQILMSSCNAEQLRAISLRYFNPIGAHESGVIGEFPAGIPNNLLPYLTGAVSGRFDKLKVFGDDYNTPDGSCIRDYIHVCDLAEAHVKAVEQTTNNASAGFTAYNIGTGKGYSVLEIINAFEKSTGEKVPFEIAPRRDGDIPMIWGDTSKAEKELNWKAHRTLENMVSSAWNFEKKINIPDAKF